VSIRLTGANCEFDGETLNGVAVVTDDGRGMVAIGMNSGRTHGAFAVFSR